MILQAQGEYHLYVSNHYRESKQRQQGRSQLFATLDAQSIKKDVGNYYSMHYMWDESGHQSTHLATLLVNKNHIKYVIVANDV